MLSTKWMIPVVCASTFLAAQSVADINSLEAVASHYVSGGMASSHDPQALNLCKVAGDAGGPIPGLLMGKAADVQHWTFLYRIATGQAGAQEDPSAPSAEPHRSVLAECTEGVFGNFRYSPDSVSGLKSLDNTWVAVPLDAAISSLVAIGYPWGFDRVAIIRPDGGSLSDDMVYVFDCPTVRQEVAVSCQTGALAWTVSY